MLVLASISKWNDASLILSWLHQNRVATLVRTACENPLWRSKRKTTAVHFQVQPRPLSPSSYGHVRCVPLSLCQQAGHSKLFCSAASLNYCYSTSIRTSCGHPHIQQRGSQFTSITHLNPPWHISNPGKQKNNLLLWSGAVEFQIIMIIIWAFLHFVHRWLI